MSEEDKILALHDEFYKNTPPEELQKMVDEINKTVLKTEGITFEGYLRSLSQHIPTLTIVTCDDWQVLYVDGVKKRENHTLTIADLAEYIDIKRINIELSDEEKDSFKFPDNEEDISRK